eukprot:scaffold94310_cov18-Tisochrysis_lutea.AAC.1
MVSERCAPGPRHDVARSTAAALPAPHPVAARSGVFAAAASAVQRAIWCFWPDDWDCRPRRAEGRGGGMEAD